MAIKINAGEVGRSEMHLIWPQEIVVDQTKNSRSEPHDEATIRERMESYEIPDASGKPIGQITPVVVRRIAENRVQLVAGYCRHAAMVLYNQEHPESAMRLKCLVQDMNEEEALQKAAIENHERKEASPMDIAFTQRRFREEFNWTDSKIAGFYKMSQGYVNQLKKLIMLPRELQQKVHRKELAVDAAVNLASLSDEERKEIIAEITAPETPATPQPNGEVPAPTPESNGKISTDKVKKAVRKKKQAAGKATPARTLSEVREFWEGNTGIGEDKWLRNLAELNIEYIRGKITDATMLSRLTDLFDKPFEQGEIQKPSQTFSELAAEVEGDATEGFLPPEEYESGV